jgi:hypothetical protein
MGQNKFMNALIIKKILGKTSYTITGDSVEIREHNMFSQNMVNAILDTYEFRSYITTLSSKKLFWTSMVFLSFTIIMTLGVLSESKVEFEAPFLYGFLTIFFYSFHSSSCGMHISI